MGNCTPQVRTSSSHISNQIQHQNRSSQQSEQKRINHQILLEPYSYLRATKSKLQDASTRGTLQRVPTIIQAIDQYHREEGYHQSTQILQEPLNILQTNSNYIFQESYLQNCQNHNGADPHLNKHFNSQNNVRTQDCTEKIQKQKGTRAQQKRQEVFTGKCPLNQTFTI